MLGLGHLSSCLSGTVVFDVFTTVTDNYFIRDAGIISKVDADKFGVGFSYAVLDVCLNIDFLSIVSIDILTHQFGVYSGLMAFAPGNFPTCHMFEIAVCLGRV